MLPSGYLFFRSAVVNYPGLRRKKLARALKDAQLDVLAVSNPVNVSYLTGFSGDSTWLLLTPKRALLVSDGRYEVQIAEECPGLETVIRKPDRTILQAVADALKKLAVRSVGLEANYISLADAEKLRDLAPSLSWCSKSGMVEGLRRIKDVSEIEQIREAIGYAEKSFAMFRVMLQPHDTEKSLVDAMEGYVRRSGGKCTAFPTLVGIGDRSALPHVPPTDRRVDEAAFLLLDWGASGRFYKSDLTRMIVTGPMDRKVESRLEKLYITVLTAQEMAIKGIRPGVKAEDVDRSVRAYLESEGLADQFNHGLGHGFGLQIHEGPFTRPNSTDVFESGMVTTVEPGVYFPDWGGIRIEDDVLITPEGCELLTSVPKDPASALAVN
jgi:Xaa-Pro aminopeptidase